MRINSNFTSGSEISSGSGTTARNASNSVRYVMIRNSRCLNWYGPRGNAGLVSGIANAVALTSEMFTASSQEMPADILLPLLDRHFLKFGRNDKLRLGCRLNLFEREFGIIFYQLQALIGHVHNAHVGYNHVHLFDGRERQGALLQYFVGTLISVLGGNNDLSWRLPPDPLLRPCPEPFSPV